MARIYRPRAWFTGGSAAPAFTAVWLVFAVAGAIAGLFQDGLSQPGWFLWVGFALPLGAFILRTQLRYARWVEVDGPVVTIVGHWGRRESLTAGEVRDVRRQWLFPYLGATRIRTPDRTWYLAPIRDREDLLAALGQHGHRGQHSQPGADEAR